MRLFPRVTTAATILPVSVEDAREHCNIDHDEDDAELTAFIQAAFEYLQPPFGCLRLSISPQTLRLNLPYWNVEPLELPAGPVTSITSVKYFDQSNVEQTLGAGNYFLDEDTLLWAEIFAEPSLYSRPSAVRITYLTGYAADDCPATINTAILQCVAHWYENREAVQAVGPLAMMPLGFDDLIAPFRQR